MALPNDLADLVREKDRLERDACAASLAAFVRRGWRVLEPGTPYVHGHVIDAICEHLQAVTDGQITRLLITVPPGCAKSLLCSVFWPAWEWGPRGLAHHRFLSFSRVVESARVVDPG